MLKKLPPFLLLVFIYQSSFCQSNRITITGIIKNTSLEAVKDANIVNLSTRKGAVSDDQGNFEISVQQGDWLSISNVQYTSKKIKINEIIIKERKLLIHLFGFINQLKEVEIKKKTTGILEYDLVKNKKDTLPKVNEDYYNFSKMDLSKLDMGRNMRPTNAQLLTDPVANAAGVPIASAGIPDKSSIKLKALRKRISDKVALPNKLKKRLGEHFFFTTLKIPKEKYFHFLQYCEPLGIEQLYKNDKILELISVFKKESINYLKMIEKSK